MGVAEAQLMENISLWKGIRILGVDMQDGDVGVRRRSLKE